MILSSLVASVDAKHVLMLTEAEAPQPACHVHDSVLWHMIDST
jgi:hypothetical protein